MDIPNDRVLCMANKEMMCNYCQVEKKEGYIGGGTYTWTCTKCGSRTESNQHQWALKEYAYGVNLKVY